jgi:hemerythrin-like metal-binding protein
MAYIKWDTSYETGIKKFDAQHQKLVNLINDLYEGMQQGKGKETVGRVLEELIKYTKEHFADEEALMQQYNYPGYLAQKGEHERLVKEVVTLMEKHKSGAMSLSIETSTFLKNWLTNHILGVDKKYSVFFQGKGVS